MKPSLRRLRERYDLATDDAKRQVQAYAQMRALAKSFRGDEKLVEWWDANCKGRRSDDIQPIIRRGVAHNEITLDQAKLLLDFLTSQGILGPEP